MKKVRTILATTLIFATLCVGCSVKAPVEEILGTDTDTSISTEVSTIESSEKEEKDNETEVKTTETTKTEEKEVAKATANPSTAKATAAPTTKPSAKATAAPTAKPTQKPASGSNSGATSGGSSNSGGSSAGTNSGQASKPSQPSTPTATVTPTAKPTAAPTTIPAPKPTAAPTAKPVATVAPTLAPTEAPVVIPDHVLNGVGIGNGGIGSGTSGCDHDFVVLKYCSYTPPTCGHEGGATGQCKKCGLIYYITAPATGQHTYIVEKEFGAEVPLCADPKMIQYMCTGCLHRYHEDVYDPNNHVENGTCYDAYGYCYGCGAKIVEITCQHEFEYHGYNNTYFCKICGRGTKVLK